MKRTIIDDILDRKPLQRKKSDRPKRGLVQFLCEEISTDYGLFSFEGHEPLRFLAELIERMILERQTDARLAVEKAEQIGFSTFAIGVALWCVAELGYNVGYFFPDDKMASEFGAARFNPIIAASLFLAGRAKDGGVDRGVLKELSDRKYIYLKGLSDLKGAISNPQDIQFLDEFDKISTAVAKWTGGRMTHSKLRVALRFSAPYTQSSGIDKSFAEGSQHRLLIKCVACGAGDICLEEAFPECMREFNGTWVRVCPQCKKKLDLVEHSIWVASYPDREKEGNYSFRLSAISMSAIDAKKIMSDYKKALDSGDPEEMAIFDRTKRAIANAGAMQPFTATVLRRLSQGHDYVLSIAPTANPVFFGVDCGNKCWFWAEEWLPEGRPRLIYAEVLNSDSWVERTIYLANRLGAQFGVVDKKPLTTDSRKIAYAMPERVALLDFVNSSELLLVKEQLVVEDAVGGAQDPSGPEYLCVKIDRDLALAKFCADAVHVDRGLILPNEQSRTMQLIGQHLQKLQKVATTNASHNDIHRFIDKVDNHFGMAGASARLARLVAPRVEPFAFYEVDMKAGRLNVDVDVDDFDEGLRARRLH